MMSPQGLQMTSEMKDIDSLARLSGRMECESPNRHLYEFVGNLKLDGHRLGYGPVLSYGLLASGGRSANRLIGRCFCSSSFIICNTFHIV